MVPSFSFRYFALKYRNKNEITFNQLLSVLFDDCGCVTDFEKAYNEGTLSPILNLKIQDIICA